MDVPPPRPTTERVRHARARLAADVDLWIATAAEDGEPYLIPLSYLWHEHRIFLATPETSTTVRNVRRDPRVRLTLDGTRDVVLIDGQAQVAPAGDIDRPLADAYAAHAGWDPRDDPATAWIVVTPTRIRAWREANELAGREIMRDGVWADEA